MSITNLFDGDTTREERRRADRAAAAEQAREDERLEREQRREDVRQRAEQRREDERQAREERRRDEAAAEKSAAKAKREKEEAKAARRVRRAASRRVFVAAVSEHMPPAGIPVVLVSLVMGWSGQAGAAIALGMGAFAVGVPVLFEGLVVTLAGLTSAAIGKDRPYKFLLGATWVSAVVAAAANLAGHLIQDSSPAGIYRAGAYAVASLVAVVLWALVMRSKRAALTGVQAAEVARWRRLRRRHPVVARRARRIADLTGAEFSQAFATAWERTHGADVTQPVISEIRDTKRSAYRRAVVEAWDGRRRGDRRLVEPAAPDGDAVEAAEAVAVEAEPVPAEVASAEVVPDLWLPVGHGFERASRVPAERVDAVPAEAPDAVPDGPEMPFPPEKQADRATPSKESFDVSSRLLKKAAKEWNRRLQMIEKDGRYRSATGHMGVSSYSVARALKLRPEKGPAIVKALIDEQLIPAHPTAE